MFCMKCGKQIPDEAIFCNYCGCKQAIVSQPAPQPVPQPAPQPAPQPVPQPVPQPTSQPAPQPVVSTIDKAEKPKKPLGGIVATLIVVLAAFLAGKHMLAPMLASGSGSGSGGSASVENSTPANTGSKSAYDKIFKDAGVAHMGIVPTEGEKVSFAKVMNNGQISCYDYRHQKDTITGMVITNMVYTKEMTPEQREQLKESMDVKAEETKNIPALKLDYHFSGNYFVVSETYTGLENRAMREGLVILKLIEKNVPLSMKVTEKDLLAQGFIKK